MKNIVAALFAICGLFIVSTTTAQAVPFYHLITVSAVLASRNNLSADDKYVTLIGQVTGKDGDDYWFSDGTGLIRLDAGDSRLPVGSKVVIGGRIDQAFLGIGHLEIDVIHWTFAGNP